MELTDHRSQTTNNPPGITDNPKRNGTGLFSPSIMQVFLFGLVSICFILPPEKNVFCLFKPSFACPAPN